MNVDIYRRRFSELHGILVTAYDVDGVRYVSVHNFAKVMNISKQKVQRWIDKNYADFTTTLVPADRRGTPSHGYPEDVFTAYLDENPEIAKTKWDRISEWNGSEGPSSND